jgi:FAD:protein FMN transferase
MAARLERLAFRAMGTACEISVSAAPGEEQLARRTLDAGRAEIAACEHALSRFDAHSDLSILNQAGGGWVAVDGRLVRALEAAVAARTGTRGRFDPTILPALVAAGYDRSFELLETRPPTAPVGWSAGATIEFDSDAGLARLEQGAAVDLGGIGKGWSAGRAIAAMRRCWPALGGAVVDLGGDIEVSGVPPEGGRWLVDVVDPRTPGRLLATLCLTAGGVATSGRDVRRFGPGRRQHHLIDPLSGLPADRGPLTVTVVAHDAAEAEGHATALAVTPPSRAGAYLRQQPHLSALVVPATGAPVVYGDLPLSSGPRRVRVNVARVNGGLQ